MGKFHMELTKKQKTKIDDIGKKYNLKLLLLHGSYATGKQNKGSDIDIAYLCKGPAGPDIYLDIYSELEEVFSSYPVSEMDIKPMRKLDPLFCYQIAKDSQLLYGNLQDYSEFRAYAFKFYHDARDLFKLEEFQVSKYQKYLNKKYA